MRSRIAWIIPPGSFDYRLHDGVKMVVPHSLHAVPASHVGLARVFTAIADGMDKSAAIIFLILFTGGAVGVIEATGAISSALSGVGRRAGAGDFPIIVSVAGVFSILGTTGVVMNSVRRHRLWQMGQVRAAVGTILVSDQLYCPSHRRSYPLGTFLNAPRRCYSRNFAPFA